MGSVSQDVKGYREIDTTLGMGASIKLMADYFEAQVDELKNIINQLILKSELQSEQINMLRTVQPKVERVVTACTLMAAKVDATATPATSFVSTFNNNI